MRFEVVSIITLLAVHFGFAISTLKSDEDGKRGAHDDFSIDIAFDLPDLTAVVDTMSGEFQLEAFKWSKNDQILEKLGQLSNVGAPTSISTELRWVSIGYVTFVKTTDPKHPNTTNLFHTTEDGFTTYIDMLSPAHRNVLAEVAKKKYRVDVTGDQIFHLILSKFECSRKMYDKSTGAKYLLKGEVSGFHHFPLQMDFEAPHGSIERRLFNKELDGEGRSRKFNCRVFSHGKVLKTNTLTITSYDQQLIGLEEKLFGSSNTSATEMREIATDVLVTRVQASELANEMYSSLNILEDYDMPELQFSEAFVNDLISKIAGSTFAHVPIDEALSSLSKYGFDIREDLKPDVFKRNLGSLFTIETIGDESKIVLNSKNKDHLDTSSSIEGEAEVSGSVGIPLVLEASVKGAVKIAYKNAYSQGSEGETLSDQLKKLNSQTQNDVKWEIEGNRIVPKSLNVFRMARSKLGKTLSFSRVRRQTVTALFDRYFSLNPNRAVADMPILEKMMYDISNLRNLVDQLESGFNNRFQTSDNPCLNGAKCVDLCSNYSCICKVGYLGRNCQAPNLALGRPTTASSQFNSWASSRVVDGNYNNDAFSGQSCYGGSSGPGAGNWLQIDLGQLYTIGYVVLFDRGDNMNYQYPGLLGYFIAGVTNTSSAIQAPVRNTYSICGTYPSRSPSGGRMPVKCADNTPPARYVIIQQPADGPGYPSYCEVEVYYVF